MNIRGERLENNRCDKNKIEKEKSNIKMRRCKRKYTRQEILEKKMKVRKIHNKGSLIVYVNSFSLLINQSSKSEQV